ncbi:MAG: haloalkane dehalogenase [Bacteroidota bacterium]
MKILKTPADRFLNLPDYPFEPHFLPVDDGLEMHYIDEGPTDGEVVLMLHGEPSWSYLYRFMIPVFVDQGYRAIAPDLIGFGKSDKPTEQADYTYQRHRDWVWNFIEALSLKDITLVCQDWGGLLGLRLAGEYPDRFARISASNTFLPTGQMPMPKSFKEWQQFAATAPAFDVGRILQRATVRELSEAEVAAYNAPFPDDSYQAGARVFPALVPTTEDQAGAPENREAWKTLQQWEKPFQTAFGDSDPITRGAEKIFQAMIPGCKGQSHERLPDGGHFVQEDQGKAWAEKVVAMMQAS